MLRILFFLLFLLSVTFVHADSSVELLMVGSFHGDEVSARSGEYWMSLVPCKEGACLEGVELEVTLEHDPVIDNEKSVKSGKAISFRKDGIGIAHRSQFLVRASFLRAGPVEVASRSQSVGQLFPGQRFYYSLAASKVSYVVFASGQAVQDEYEYVTIQDYCFNLTIHSQTQKLMCMKGIGRSGQVPGVVWAGDLDRDGKLDLLLDTSNHYNVMEKTLFLSSLASHGEHLRKAATFRTTGC